MEVVKYYTGSREEVWAAVEKYLAIQKILMERGERWTWGTVIPPSPVRQMWFNSFHTGTDAQLIVAVSDEDSGSAFGIMMKGVNWNIEELIESVAGAVSKVYSEYEYRHQRSIMLQFGEMAYRSLSELNEKESLESTTNEITFEDCLYLRPLMASIWRSSFAFIISCKANTAKKCNCYALRLGILFFDTAGSKNCKDRHRNRTLKL
jgi:hypothetical protein